MSAQANKATVLRYFHATHNPPYDLSVMDETCSPDYAEAGKRWQQMERLAFPDKRFTVEHVIAEDDKVVLRWSVEATHLGEFWTPVGVVPPTGNRISHSATVIYRLEDGRIVEEWSEPDWLTLLRQFGAEIRVVGMADAQ